jgi:uncharacterized phage protein gp47/JayE
MIGQDLEKYTFEYLMSQALVRVSDDLDKREGSIIYDALAPACYALSEAYMELRMVLINTFASMANGEYLDLRASEHGVIRYAATAAVRKGVFVMDSGAPAIIPIGSRFSTISETESVNFSVLAPYTDSTGNVEPGSYNLVCEELGTVGNEYTGALLPISNISGLKSAIMSTVVTPARDVETDEELRTRYFEEINRKAFGGNISQYDQEIKAISGVGEVQIYPVWDGGGTVKCSIIDAEYNTISNDFITQIQDLVDPTPQGTGLGIAPIGHKVTIVTPTKLALNIKTTVVLTNSYTLSQVESQVTSAIEKYLLELRQTWGLSDELNNYSLSVYIARINAAILSVPGIANVTNTTINGSAADIILQENATTQQLPVLGGVTISV